MRSDASVFVCKLMINEYCKFSNQPELSDPDAMASMITDMRHYCSSRDLDFQSIIGQSERNFKNDV